MTESDQTRQARLEVLRRQIAKAASFSTRGVGTVPLGIEAIDSCLGGGLARGALHEVAATDHRSIPAALGFLLALTQCQKRLPSYPPPLAGEVDRCAAASRKGEWFLPRLRGMGTTRSVAAFAFSFGGPSEVNLPRRSQRRSRVEGAGASAPLGASRHSPRKRGENQFSAPPPQAGEDSTLRTNYRFQSNILWPFTKTVPAFGQPYAPGLKFFGLDPARIVFVRCANARECLWAMEEGLRLGGIGAVIGARAKAMDLTSSRRLQLAAEQANIPVFLLRAYNDNAQSAAVTRWRVAPASSARDQFDFTKNVRFRVALDYARGGKTGDWVLEWNSDSHSLRLSPALGDRAAGENRAA